jgi:hypothetical protein
MDHQHITSLARAFSRQSLDKWIDRQLCHPKETPFFRDRLRQNTYDAQLHRQALEYMRKSLAMPVTKPNWPVIWCDMCSFYHELWIRKTKPAPKHRQAYEQYMKRLDKLRDKMFHELLLELFPKCDTIKPVKVEVPSLSWDPFKNKTDDELKQIAQELVDKTESTLEYNLVYAETLRRHLRKHQKELCELSDRDRMDHFRTIAPQFLQSFPIVSKYMVLLHDYNYGAFKRLLMKM